MEFFNKVSNGQRWQQLLKSFASSNKGQLNQALSIAKIERNLKKNKLGALQTI